MPEQIENAMVVDSHWKSTDPVERTIYCDRCHEEIENDVYEDEYHEYLCECCLHLLHEKR